MPLPRVNALSPAALPSTTAGFVMLGMLRVGSSSGYEVRRSAELSIRHFWAISPSQIYSELTDLEGKGLIRGKDEPRGVRQRRTYELLPAGERALEGWLRDLEIGNLELRDLGQLKLFLADALDPEHQRDLIEAIRERSREYVSRIEQQVIPAAQKTTARHGMSFPGRVAALHVELHEFLAGWCDRLDAELSPATTAAEGTARSSRTRAVPSP